MDNKEETMSDEESFKERAIIKPKVQDFNRWFREEYWGHRKSTFSERVRKLAEYILKTELELERSLTKEELISLRNSLIRDWLVSIRTAREYIQEAKLFLGFYKEDLEG